MVKYQPVNGNLTEQLRLQALRVKNVQVLAWPLNGGLKTERTPTNLLEIVQIWS